MSIQNNSLAISDGRKADAYLRIVPSFCKNPTIRLEVDALTLIGRPYYDAGTYCREKSNKRDRIYKKENKTEHKKLSEVTQVRILKDDLAKNSAIMSTSVSICTGIGSIGWIAGPVGGAPGTTLGFCVGVLIGGSIIKHCINKKINIEIQFSNHYAEWRAKAITDKVFPSFRNFLDIDNLFEDFICPISQDICSIPMLAPDGYTYNQKDIFDYIESKGAQDDQKIVSPMRVKDFCKNDLVVNHQYCKNLIIKAQEAYAKVLQISEDNVAKYGLDAVIQNTTDLMESIRIQVAYQIFAGCDAKIKSGEMSAAERDDVIDRACVQWDFRKSK